ncbi:NAD(P)H-hydrate dehydratase [Aureimonas ureilytica]|uniref:NAD(P)H-hydrate dehydratase n=1 Tax=Aureimonas ureilytica TaxID=401562 RepID=UPI003CFA909C
MDVLIAAAGRAVADAMLARFANSRRVAVLVGKGNNGKDALAAVEHLRESGWGANVFEGESLGAFEATDCDLILDGLLGAGLDRDVEGVEALAIDRATASRLPVVSIDVPSGVDGRTGQVRGQALRADLTVTFVRRKPGHLLLPGRDLCGEILVAELPMPSGAIEAATEDAPPIFANEPPLWRRYAAAPLSAHHKYDRGHAVVFSGGMARTGAARLAAMAALRGGAGLVTLLSPASALLVNAHHLTGIMLKRCEGNDLPGLLEDKRWNAFVLGPGFGIGERAREMAGEVLSAGRRLVLDADGLTSFKDEPETLFQAAEAARVEEVALVLTPHSGEFARLFPDLASDKALSKVDQARLASRRANAIMVLKGADTVIAAPDGRAAINATGTPWLATAGTGDVLTGLIAAQLAQGLPTFEATCLGVWMHGRAAETFGPGLISEDLPNCLPAVHRELGEIAKAESTPPPRP